MAWLWRAGFAALALVTIGAQLDRASYVRPELSVLVPNQFRSSAQSTIALLALATGDASSAQIEARRLLRRRPMPAEHLYVLALAEMRKGHPRKFAASFRAASMRGWRFTPLQATAAEAALLDKDVKGAANRTAAMWATDPDNPLVLSLTRRLLQTPGGPEAFGVPLAGTHVWSGTFLARAPQLGAPTEASNAVVAAKRAGAHFDCGALRRFVEAIQAADRDADRAALACSN